MSRVLIVGQLDGYANQLKPVRIAEFLRARGHRVTLADTYLLSRAGSTRGTRAARLPWPTPGRLALYATEAAGALLLRRSQTARHRLSAPLLLAEHRLRRAILRRALPLADYDLVVCEDPYDAGVLVGAPASSLYDCPTPWADELYYEGRLTERQHRSMRRREAALFEQVDHLAFHWESYASYAVAHYGISERNLLTLNFGCVPAARRAQFAAPPRIAYLGSLSSRFIDLPLLARLARRYPAIDVWGGPPPDPALGLTYRGYAERSDVLCEYQLGLITCTRDALRRDGFSAKHLDYFAHGLPVLAPAWRRHLEDLPGSVPYTEEDFSEVVARLAHPANWSRLSDLAYARAEQLAWERTLQPLADLLDRLPPRQDPRPGDDAGRKADVAGRRRRSRRAGRARHPGAAGSAGRVAGP